MFGVLNPFLKLVFFSRCFGKRLIKKIFGPFFSTDGDIAKYLWPRPLRTPKYPLPSSSLHVVRLATASRSLSPKARPAKSNARRDSPTGS